LKTRLAILTATAACCLLAQPPGPPSLDALKTYLNLTDSQVQALQQIQQQERQTNRATVQKMRQSQANLDDLIQKGGADAATAGRLLLEIQDMQASLSKSHATFSAQSASTLTVDQKSKLKSLQDAMALMPAIHQAAGVGLLAMPQDAAGATTRFRGGPGGPRRHGPPPPPAGN
jgi:Spy/CpxP family protein refolding chaperone